MPKLTKQLVPPPTAPAANLNGMAPAGSVLSEAIPVGDLKSDFLRVSIYGRNRVGKTYLSCQFRKPLLLVSFEPSNTGGARTVKKVPGVTLLHLQNRTWTDPVTGRKHAEWGKDKALRLCSEMETLKPFPFATVVIDTATSLQDIILQEILNLPDIPVMLNWGIASLDQYRDRSSICREVLRKFFRLPCDVVVLSQERDHNPPKDPSKGKLTRGLTTESCFAEDLGDGTVKWLHDVCDHLCQLYFDKETVTTYPETTINGKTTRSEIPSVVETGRQIRRLRTMYDVNYWAGFRSECPEMVPQFIEDPTYEKILQVIEGKRLLNQKNGYTDGQLRAK